MVTPSPLLLLLLLVLELPLLLVRMRLLRARRRVVTPRLRLLPVLVRRQLLRHLQARGRRPRLPRRRLQHQHPLPRPRRVRVCLSRRVGVVLHLLVLN